MSCQSVNVIQTGFLTAHFIEEVLIDFQEIIGEHSGANLAAAVWRTLEYYGLTKKV